MSVWASGRAVAGSASGARAVGETASCAGIALVAPGAKRSVTPSGADFLGADNVRIFAATPPCAVVAKGVDRAGALSGKVAIDAPSGGILAGTSTRTAAGAHTKAACCRSIGS